MAHVTLPAPIPNAISKPGPDPHSATPSPRVSCETVKL
jgi:hypothetical protein